MLLDLWHLKFENCMIHYFLSVWKIPSEFLKLETDKKITWKSDVAQIENVAKCFQIERHGSWAKHVKFRLRIIFKIMQSIPNGHTLSLTTIAYWLWGQNRLYRAKVRCKPTLRITNHALSEICRFSFQYTVKIQIEMYYFHITIGLFRCRN